MLSDLTNLISYVKGKLTNSSTKLVWHMTWAYQGNSGHQDFPKYDRNQMTMYNAIVNSQYKETTYDEFLVQFTANNLQEVEFRHDRIVYLTKEEAAKPAAEQKKTFEALLTTSLGEDCSLEVVQTVHDQLCESIQMHKESKGADPLLVDKQQVKSALESSGVSPEKVAKCKKSYTGQYLNKIL